ncbi:MAG: hypothetical protein ABSB28_10785 [Candidatus Bathyarchaeia archaeon]
MSLLTYKKIVAQETTVRYVVLVFLGAGINFTLGYALMAAGLTALIQSPVQTLTSKVPQTTLILAVSYLLIGIVYSLVASLTSRPKRIISPLHIQIITATFVPILITFLLATVPLTPPIDLIAGSVMALALFFLALVMFVAAGIGQTIVVRYLVGLNGTKENVNSFGLTVNGKVRDILRVLTSADVREALEIHERDDRQTGEHSYVFRTSPNSGKQLFIAIIEDSEDKTKTQLATVSYRQTYYGISKLGEVIEEQRQRTIKAALERAGLTCEDDKTDSLARLLAYNHGLSITDSKLLSLRSLPPYSKAILTGLAAMIVIMTLMWRFTDYVSADLYETFLVLAGFSVLFDLLPILRTKRKRFET